MRILRFNEAKRNKKDMNQEYADKYAALKKSWQDFEDQNPWDFEYFWQKIEKYASDYETRNQDARGISNGYVDFKVETMSYDRENHDPDWQKRRARISAQTCTGGWSGGSCWDDGYARPYETGNSLDMDDFLKWVGCILYHIFGKSHPFADIPELLQKLRESNLIKEDDYTNYEYYGNSDDYILYYITLWDLYQFLAKNSAF